MNSHAPSSAKRVVIYARISKDRTDQTSIGTQIESCTQYAASKGWEVVDTFTDVGRSAFKGVTRHELDKALHLIDVGAANVLLVWKLDRFTRSTRDFHGYWQRIKEAGGVFASVTESFDTSTAMGRAMVGIIITFAELESAQKSDRADEWNKHRLATGAVPCGPRPFGYNRVNRMLEVNESEAAWLRTSAARLLEGDSLRAIINASEVIGSRGTPLTYRGLRAALTNPTTAGFRQDDEGELIKGSWEPIIDEGTFTALRELLTDPARKTSPHDTKVRHLLGGILTCDKDGCTDRYMQVRNWHHRGQPNRQRYTCRGCGNSIFADQADEAITAYLMDLVPQDDWNKLRTQGRGYNPLVVAELESEAASFVAMAARGTIKPEALATIMEGINDRMASAMGDEALDLPDVDNLATEWEALPVADKRRVLRAVFESVTLSPSTPSAKGIARLDAMRKS